MARNDTHGAADGGWPWGLAIDAEDEVFWIGFDGPATLEEAVAWLLDGSDVFDPSTASGRGHVLASLDRVSAAVGDLDLRLAPAARVVWWGPCDLLRDADGPLARLLRVEFRRRRDSAGDDPAPIRTDEVTHFREFLIERD